MIFSDPSGDEGIHPVSLLQLPVVIPPPTPGEIVHRSMHSVITYSKPIKRKPPTNSLQKPVDIEHFHYKVKELLDDGTGSSVDKAINQFIFTETSPRAKINTKASITLKATKFLADGSALLKQEIQNSEARVYKIRAGKGLTNIFPNNLKKFVGPNKNLYNRHSLGTPGYEENNKSLDYNGRRQQVSLMNSYPQRPFILLPSLKDILLNNEQSKEGIFEAGADLTQKFDKLQKSLTKKNRKDARLVVEGHEKKLINIVKNHLKGEAIKETLGEDSISHLMERFSDFNEGKEKLKNKLTDILATQKYDRPETIWLKYKHFKTSVKKSVHQGRMVDIWNMRMEAEKERLEHNRGMMSQVCWYRDMLWFTIEKCNDISPNTYYILDYIKALTEECIVVTKELMHVCFERIPQQDRTGGLNLLMTRILLDL